MEYFTKSRALARFKNNLKLSLMVRGKSSTYIKYDIFGTFKTKETIFTKALRMLYETRILFPNFFVNMEPV